MFNNISDAYMFALKTVYFNYEFVNAGISKENVSIKNDPLFENKYY